MILGRAWNAATAKAVVEPAKLSTLGHVQVFAEDAAADEGGEISFISPQNNYRLIPEPQKLIDTVLREEPRLAAGIARLMVGALLSSGDVSMEGLLIGMDPRARAAVYPALELREGRFFEPGEKGILLNRGVARKLGVGVGGTVVALGTTADGRISGVKLPVTGIWMVRGLDAYEWGSCFTDIAAVQELLDAGDAAGVIVFRQKDGDAAVRARGRVGDGGASAERYPRPRLDLGGDGRALHRRHDRHPLRGRDPPRGPRDHRRRRGAEHRPHVGLRADARDRDDPGGRLAALPRGGALPARGPLPRGGRRRGRRAPRGRAWCTASPSTASRPSARRSATPTAGTASTPTLAWGDLVSVPAMMVVVSVLASLGPAVMAARMRPADALRHV